MIDHRLIEILATNDVVELQWVSELLALETPRLLDRVSLSDLVELSTRLPVGLIHAESIWILETRPSDLPPLAEGSAWSAMDRSLVVEVPSAGDLFALLLDLGRYHLAARAVRAKLSGRSELIDALGFSERGGADRQRERPEGSSARSPLLSAELGVLLEAGAEDIQGADPAILADVAAMAQIDFSPSVHLHDDVRPDRQRERGARLADDLIARLPEGPFAVLITDSAAAIDLLSPYVRDLGHALIRWGLENPETIRTFGLVDVLREKEGALEADLASLVVPDLMVRAPHLIEERRSNEASQGLLLDDGRGSVFGYAELHRLEAPDRCVVPEDARGTLVVAIARRSEVLHAALERFLATRRVAGVANVLASDSRHDVVVARSLVSDDDGFLLAGADALLVTAGDLAIEVHPTDRLDRPPDPLLRLLRSVRRARVIGDLSDSAQVYSVLYARLADGVSPTVRGRRCALVAARLALATLVSPPSPDRSHDAKAATSGAKPSVPRRFRA